VVVTAKKEIKFGYEIGTGKEIKIKPTHLVVSGITAESGKTTTLNSFIKRGNFRAVIFRTKVGEKAIMEGTIVPPFYKDEFDWEYATELLEASRKEKLKFERSWIIKYSKTASNLLEFKQNIDNALAEGKLRSLEKSVLITLQAYLEKILPELQYAPLSNTLNLQEGINIMDLERFKEETQGLIIRSVLSEVLKHHKNTFVVIPEAWKYLPERLGSPVKRPAEAFIRQGATNGNYLAIDSQDLTSTAKSILKQVSTWILGYQREINEIKRTLDQVPLPKKQKPKPNDIASLKVGHFYVATSNFTKKCYMQPTWVDNKTAKAIALGKKKVEDLEPPKSVAPFSIQKPQLVEDKATIDLSPMRKEITELRNDFFNKIAEQQEAINKVYQELFHLKQGQQNMDIDEIVGKVLQKIPMNNHQPTPSNNEIESLKKQIEKINGAIGGLKAGGTVYEVVPIEKIKKDFMQEAKDKIISDIETLNDDQKKILKYVETKEQDVTPSELITKCLMLKVGGSQSVKMSNLLKGLLTVEIIEKTAGGRYRRGLKKRIKELVGNHEATEQEIEQIYNNILMEIL